MTIWSSIVLLSVLLSVGGALYWTWKATTKLEQAKAKEAAAVKERDQRQQAREALSAARDEFKSMEEDVKKVDDKALDERLSRWTK